MVYVLMMGTLTFRGEDARRFCGDMSSFFGVREEAGPCAVGVGFEVRYYLYKHLRSVSIAQKNNRPVPQLGGYF